LVLIDGILPPVENTMQDRFRVVLAAPCLCSHFSGLRSEDARVVDEGVDVAVAVDRSSDDAFGGGWVSDVALDGQDVLVVGGRDRARVGDDCLAELPVGVDQGGADALRGSSDDGDLLQRCLHSELLLPVRDEFPCQPARPMSIASLPPASRSAVMSGGRA